MFIFRLILSLLISYSLVFSANLRIENRGDWKLKNYDINEGSTPSNLKYFKFYDVLPDDINYELFKHKNIDSLKDKKLYVGYGVVDPNGKDCLILRKEDTGLKIDTKICLPWFRIEREYKTEQNPLSLLPSTLETLSKPRPPLMVNVCKKRGVAKRYQGGVTTCTSYFDKTAGGGCWNNPEQQRCYVNNCSRGITEQCEYIGSQIGDKKTLEGAVILEEQGNSGPSQASTKLNLTTHTYKCPSGTIVQGPCEERKDVLMFPYECKVDDPTTPLDDGEYTYCDEDKPIYDETGNITAFQGKCKDGTPMKCKVNSFKKTTSRCIEPIYETYTKTETFDYVDTRNYTEKSVDVLSGNPDMYSDNPNCLRSNTVEDARKQELFVKINGSGRLDDDIYIMRHKSDGTFVKVYCNMQHNEDNGNRKNYNGQVIQCIDNNGSYSFNKTVKIDTTDLVSVQQNTENENQTGTPFALGRTHYSSTKVRIDNIEVAPPSFPSNFPYYPNNGGNLKTWDNALGTLSILFPFSGAYQLFFYNKSGQQIAEYGLTDNDFKTINKNDSLQVMLGKRMTLAPGIKEDEKDDQNAARNDMWVEFGGGVYGGRDSNSGEAVQSPNDAYVKENAIYNVVVKDLLTGSVTPIPLSYPLPYANRIFISKLKVYENRKYRCYDDFKPFQAPDSNAREMFVCSKEQIWKDYKSGVRNNIDKLQQWDNKSLCEQNCFDQNVCSTKEVNDIVGFTCNSTDNSNINGDLGDNFFSNENECNLKCRKTYTCDSYIQNDCELVDEQLEKQAQDYTGKTLFRQRNVSYKCTRKVQKQTGCNKYDVQIAEGDININIDALGYETKDYSNAAEDALVKANMLDVGSQHIFSGWKGKCVIGMKMDSSYLSDPMTIVSYAMSAYNSYTYLNNDVSLWDQFSESDYGKTIKEGADKVTDAYDSAVEGVKDTYDNAVEKVGKLFSSDGAEGAEGAAGGAAGGASGGAAEGATGGATGGADTSDFNIDLKKFDDILNKEIIDGKDYLWKTITVRDLAKLGVSLTLDILAPTEDEFKLAEKLLQPYNNEDDVGVQAYTSCMSSIGLSFPALIGYSLNEPDASSNELRKPWEHPIRLTSNQLEMIVQTMGEEYVKHNYMYRSDSDGMLINIASKNAEAYTMAGQVVCAGAKVAQTMSYLNSKKDDTPDLGGNGSNMALSMAISVVSMFNPVIGFALKIAMDLFVNMFAKIDTCNDEVDAMARSLLEYKTLKFNKESQLCHPTREYCDKKFSFGFVKKCVRKGYDFCCYDKQTTKIFAIGLKEQLNQGWNNCVGITINDLKDVSFRECKDNEVPHIDKCISTKNYSEYKNTLFKQANKNINSNVLIEQIQEAMSQGY